MRTFRIQKHFITPLLFCFFALGLLPHHHAEGGESHDPHDVHHFSQLHTEHGTMDIEALCLKDITAKCHFDDAPDLFLLSRTLKPSQNSPQSVFRQVSFQAPAIRPLTCFQKQSPLPHLQTSTDYFTRSVRLTI